MSTSFYRSMLWLHRGVGVCAAWLLFTIFVTGTLAYFHPEITYWMQPRLHAASPEQAATSALERLHAVAPDAQSWGIDLPAERYPVLAIRWRSDDGRSGGEVLDATDGRPIRLGDTYGGSLFYSFHFTLMMRGWGYWFTGAAALWMLVAVFSGIVAHRKLLADFFTLRIARSPQRAWLDVHNVTAVLALPFYVMIAYTGLVTLLFSYMPWGLTAAYGDRPNHFFSEAFTAPTGTQAARALSQQTTLAALTAAPAAFVSGSPRAIEVVIQDPRSVEATVVIHRAKPDPGGILPYTGTANPMSVLHDALYELHVARFAGGPFLRLLLFASGIVGSVMIAAGLVVWAQRRSAGRDAHEMSIGAIVERLNVGVLCGLLIAIATYFWANRLLPAGLDAQSQWEARGFFAAWAIAGCHALACRPVTGWRQQLWAVALLFAGLPLVSALTTGRHTLGSVAAGDGVYVAFDLLAWAVAISAGSLALRLRPAARLPVAAEHDDGARRIGRRREDVRPLDAVVGLDIVQPQNVAARGVNALPDRSVGQHEVDLHRRGRGVEPQYAVELVARRRAQRE